ncbi:hypothetical protein J1614_008780 [Plenodomus biglobosus]|nr:hypothetical protein J1614_008780 [Plenodomus biglobosus]
MTAGLSLVEDGSVHNTLGSLSILSRYCPSRSQSCTTSDESGDVLILSPSSTYTNPTTGAVIDYYEVEVRSIQKQIYPNLGVADLYAYDGLQPGPTFMMHKGRGKIYSVDSLL